MRFLYPSLFYAWAALVAVPILLYLFRPRPRTVRTSTLPFFKWLAREHQDSAWLRRLKRLLSLLLSLLLILAASAALGRLVVSPASDEVRTAVLLVARSASMAAVAGEGRTRLDAALDAARERLAGLPAGVGVVVMAYDRRPEVLLARSLDHRSVRRALDGIRVKPAAGDAVPALKLARQLAALETPATIWHLTDGPETTDEPATDEDEQSPPTEDENAEITVTHVPLPLSEPTNVGITAFELRRRPLERSGLEAFVQVRCASPETVTAELEIRQNGVPVALRNLTLEPCGQETLLIPVTADEAGDKTLRLKVTAPGDVLPLDDLVLARIPQARPLRVLWIAESPDPFTELALSSLGSEYEIEVLQGTPASWPPQEVPDVTIFDHWLPDEWPAEGAVIAISPPRSAGPIQAAAIQSDGLPLESVRETRPDHPLLYGVATGRVAVTQTTVLAADGPLQPLWVGLQGPVLLAGEVGRQRVAVLGFDPAKSESLPLLASYPLLMGNAIFWTTETAARAAAGRHEATGELVELDARTLTWTTDVGKELKTENPVELTGRWTELDRIGLWETDTGLTGSAALLSPQETLLPARVESLADEADADAATASLLRGDLAPVLIWSLVALLIAESWLFHRYTAY